MKCTRKVIINLCFCLNTIFLVHITSRGQWLLCLPLQGRETYCFSQGVCLSQIVSLKLYSQNFIQISISMRDDVQSARMATLPFILFELFPLELCPSQTSCPLYNLKTALAILTKLYTNINQHEMRCRW